MISNLAKNLACELTEAACELPYLAVVWLMLGLLPTLDPVDNLTSKAPKLQAEILGLEAEYAALVGRISTRLLTASALEPDVAALSSRQKHIEKQLKKARTALDEIPAKLESARRWKPLKIAVRWGVGFVLLALLLIPHITEAVAKTRFAR